MQDELKKIFGALGITVGLLLMSSTTPASAGPGRWDYLGGCHAKNRYGNEYLTCIKYSGGGNVKFAAYPPSGRWQCFNLYEYDPGSGNDRWILSHCLGYGRHSVAIPVGKFVDGKNKKAEIYISAGERNTYVKFWD